MVHTNTAHHVVASALVIICLALLGCSNKLEGDIEVDGEEFELDSCRSGQVYGFVGVELEAEDGRRLRIVNTPTGEPVAVVLPSGSSSGVEVGTCGSFRIERQNSTVNNVTNVEGSADLECEGNGHSVKGTVEFENCH